MKNLKIWEISSFAQKQGENTKIGKFSRESRKAAMIQQFLEKMLHWI